MKEVAANYGKNKSNWSGWRKTEEDSCAGEQIQMKHSKTWIWWVIDTLKNIAFYT